jgi:hypothetical protein
MTESSPVEAVLERLAQELPPIFDRSTAHSVTGGLANRRTLANLDSTGRGPAGAIRRGKRVYYERTAFLAWLRSRLSPCRKSEASGHTA